jgi:hypothetical protein
MHKLTVTTSPTPAHALPQTSSAEHRALVAFRAEVTAGARRFLGYTQHASTRYAAAQRVYEFVRFEHPNKGFNFTRVDAPAPE